MSYPGFPFPPGTPLYPSHEHIQAYHSRYVLHFNLTRHIHFHHKVIEASWNGTSERGFWDVTYQDAENRTQRQRFGHLVVAAGHNHFPHEIAWAGQDEWLSNTPPEGPRREILHSIWYREPSRYASRRVLIVGYGASGKDAASQIAPLALEVKYSNNPRLSTKILLIQCGIRHSFPSGRSRLPSMAQ